MAVETQRRGALRPISDLPAASMVAGGDLFEMEHSLAFYKVTASQLVGGVITPAALTKTDDTNVTLTLGGSPTVALLAATSLTLGWTGQLGVARGGTGLSTFLAAGGMAYATAATALTILSIGATDRVLTSSGSAPQWSANIAYAALPTGSGSWDTGSGTTITLSRSLTVSGTLTATLTGNASTATALQNTRTIWGQNFNGTANVTGAMSGVTTLAMGGALSGVTTIATSGAINSQTISSAANFTGTLAIAGVATLTSGTVATLTFGTYLTGTSYNSSANVTLATNATAANTPSALVARDASGNFAAGTITAALTGSISGNAATATALQTARTINGVSFDGTANITITSVAPNALTAGAFLTSTGTYDGSVARTFAVDATSANTVSKVVARDSFGNFAAGTITATLTGNASTATALANARTINGVSFDGTANITVTAAAGTLTGATLNATVLASSLTSVGVLASPHFTAAVVDSGGFTVTLGGITVTGASTITGTLGGLTTVTATTFVGAHTGNSSTATALQTPRNINGVAFDGTANITVTAAAGTLTGTTLNSTVVTSSLTALGTVATGVWQGTVVGATYGGTGVNNGSSTVTLGGNLVTSGAFGLTLTLSGTTNVTLPTSGTLVNTAVTTLSSLATIGGALAMGGALTGVTTIGASGIITGASFKGASYVDATGVSGMYVAATTNDLYANSVKVIGMVSGGVLIPGTLGVTGLVTFERATRSFDCGIGGSVNGGFRIWNAVANAEGNMYGDATYSFRIDTNSNGRPIRFDGSRIDMSPPVEFFSTIKAAGIPTVAGAAGTLWVDGSGFVKRA